MQDAGCRMQDAGCRMQDAGCRMQDAGWSIDVLTIQFPYNNVSNEGQLNHVAA